MLWTFSQWKLHLTRLKCKVYIGSWYVVVPIKILMKKILFLLKAYDHDTYLNLIFRLMLNCNIQCFDDPKTQRPRDPKTQRPRDPETQRPRDPKTHRPIDPKTHRPIDPQTQRPTDPGTQGPRDPETQKPKGPLRPRYLTTQKLKDLKSRRTQRPKLPES